MQETNWQEKHKDRIGDAASAMKWIKPGSTIFIGSGCGQPDYLVKSLVEHSDHIYDAQVIHFLNAGPAPYVDEKLRERFKVNSLFISENVRECVAKGIGDYTPISSSEIAGEFERGRIPIDAALISVTPPDENGLCSLGVSVDIVKAAAANARYVVAQVNASMPRTLGDSFIHVNAIDMLVVADEPIAEAPPAPMDDSIRGMARNVAKLVEDGSTLHLGLGSVPQAVAAFLGDKKDLGIHTEALGDWVVDLVEKKVVTGAHKSINRGRIVASSCMGSRRLYDFVDGNSMFEFHPSEYVNNSSIIAGHEKMVSVNTAVELDLTGQVCVDAAGPEFCGGLGGLLDFTRGAARSGGGKAIIALPSTARNGTVSTIVPRLPEGAGVSLSRADVHYVVTEYGVAYLHGRSVRERVLSLINIAHPKFRKALIQAAKAQKYIYADQIEMSWENVRYPEEIEKYETLRDGTQIFFRPVKPSDETSLTEMLYSLSADSVHLRYLTHTMAFPHRDVQQLANIDYRQRLAIVGVVPGLARDEIVAIAQYVINPKTKTADINFIVHDEWQKKGMGTFLLRYLAQTAIEQGIKVFTARVSPENVKMLAVFQNSGYSVKTEREGEVHNLTIDLQSK